MGPRLRRLPGQPRSARRRRHWLRRERMRGSDEQRDICMITATPPVQEKKNYITATEGLKSWLLTHDHKRIAILYLLGVTFFFALGGMFAVLIRLELATPAGDLVESNTYNKLFTMHGIIMVFLFLIPSIPAVFGNFLIPLMIGAKDVAFPRLNLMSWYIYMIGGMFVLTVLFFGGVDT